MLDLAAIHTSTIVSCPVLFARRPGIPETLFLFQSFIHALFHVAANSGYADVLRQEAKEIIGNEGWSKESLGMMHKLDSFLKECQRMYSVASGE